VPLFCLSESRAREESVPRVLPPLTEQASAHLDMLRAIAAFAMLIEHWRCIYFVDCPHVHRRNFLLYVFYGATKFGHEAVIVFFVLSRYLIGRTVLRGMWARRWSGTRYAVHRLVRLELVLLPALALCWMWDSAGIHLFSPSRTYLGTSGISVLNYNVSHWLSWRIFLGNAGFLQTLLVPTLGTDNPLWSLANEFWYYALFPCLAIALMSQFSWKRRWIAVVVMIGLSLFVGKLGELGLFSRDSGRNPALFPAAFSIPGQRMVSDVRQAHRWLFLHAVPDPHARTDIFCRVA